MIERLKADFKVALKEKDTERKNIIQMVRSNIQNLARDKRVAEEELSKEEINGVLTRELKQQNDSLEAFKKGNRDDLVKETERNIEILLEYLPKQLTEKEIEDLVKETLAELGLETVDGKAKGMLMKNLMPKVKGKADGKLVNKIVGEIVK